jgi:hypothetical protein
MAGTRPGAAVPAARPSRKERGAGMADDYGDDSGQRLYDMIVRAGTVAAERSGLSARDGAMGEAAARIEEALSALRRQLGDHAAPGQAREEPRGGAAPEYARLDVRELKAIDGFEELKGIIHSDLEAHGVGNGFVEGRDGRTELVFRLDDAPRVAECLDRLIEETRRAAERAERDARARDDGDRDERGRDGEDRDDDHTGETRGDGKAVARKDRDAEPLEDRGRRAREASEAMRDGSGARDRERGRDLAPRREERSK